MASEIDRSQLENRMKNFGYTYVCTPDTPRAKGLPRYRSQPSYNSSSLPRHDARDRQMSRVASADLAGTRRKLVSNAVQDYLKSLNAMTRTIVLEKESLEEGHREDWSCMNEAAREEIVDDHFVPSGVRARYSPGTTRRQRYPSRPHSDDTLLRSRPEDGLFSQPADWEEKYENLVVANGSANWGVNDDCLSEPSPYACVGPHQPATESLHQDYKLHKLQLSLRSKHNVRSANRPLPLPHPNQLSELYSSRTRDQLGSDGDSPRTSDEDSSSVISNYSNQLGFNRTKLRSYSMRQKRGSMKANAQHHARSSTRLPHRIQKPDQPPTSAQLPTYCVPDVAYDDEIDLPDESLLLDHVRGHSDDSSSASSSKPDRYSSTRRSRRSKPNLSTITHDDDTVFANAHASRIDSHVTTPSDVRPPIPTFIVSDEADVIHNRLVHSPSHDSLDTDSVSIAPSNVSEDYSRAMTPDSLLSGSTCSYRPTSRQAELAIMRNPRGKRGGSSYKSTTSEFADRHAQFKPNMLRKQRTTDSQTPTSSTPIPPEEILSQSYQSTKSSLSPIKHDLAEHSDSVLSDHLSLMSSPPATPLHVSNLLKDHRRESGYSSSGSSYESFPVRR